MGGLLFKDCKRVDIQSYSQISADILKKFSDQGIRAQVPPALKNKDSHGDVDIVVEFPILQNDRLKEIFGDVQIHRNSNVVSIFYQEVQVDFNFFSQENFDSAVSYMAWGDTSNLLGRIFHGIGGSFGHDGLGMFVRFCDEDILGKVIISKDLKLSLDFIGLDYETWKNGFNTQEEVFEWVVKSRYFNEDKFKFENLNNINRVRNLKRPMYSAFVKWLENKEFENHYECKNKTEHLFRAMFHFGCDWFDAVKPLVEERRRKHAVRSIFSGKDLLGNYSGKELGAILTKFKDSFEDFDSFVLSKNKEEMIEIFKKFVDNSDK